MKKRILRKYAHLIAASGANVQKGQEVFITAGLEQPEFVQMLVEECYRCGAARVVVDWDCPELTRTHVKYRSLENLSTLSVDDLSLGIHDIVIFQNIFASLEVAAFHGLLGIFNGAGENLGIDWRVVVQSHGLHHILDPLGTEQTHDIVFHG